MHDGMRGGVDVVSYTMAESVHIDDAVAFLQSRIPSIPDMAMVLGSGMGSLSERLEDPLSIPFSEVPHWPVPQVTGHCADVVVGQLGGRTVACLTGRVHLYEGWESAQVVRGVRSLCHMGVKSFLLTNAAGGIAGHLRPGDLMVVSDHLNLTGSSPLVGRQHASLGPRFPDQSRVYSPRLRQILAQVDGELSEGVYAGMLGPSYETPAEVRMLRVLGAAAVGMSTVHEAMALNSMGASVAAISVISNQAAGVSDHLLGHDEVLEASRRASGRLSRILADFCAQV